VIGLGLLKDLRRALDVAGRRSRGEYDEDEWGFDPGFAAGMEPLTAFLYDKWWRVTATGTEHVPAEGRALIVANHAGVLPWDAAMMAMALRRGGLARAPRFLVLDWAFGVPWASVAIRRNGGVPASPTTPCGCCVRTTW
jgi:1-acyl-sn-glycerol-3-phosphate acyltransferase